VNRTKIVRGERLPLTPEEELEQDSLEADYLAEKPMQDWLTQIAGLDSSGITRDIENIIDSMDPIQLGRLDSRTKEKHAAKKAKRAEKPKDKRDKKSK
jgi:hypothetical protein